jgi:two-component system CheB/CheR fusion protein
MSQVHVDSVEAYITFLDRHPSEAGALFNTILINITGFLRDPRPGRRSASTSLPDCSRRRNRPARSGSGRPDAPRGRRRTRWAIMLAEELGERRCSVGVKIYGTDWTRSR